MCPTLYRIRYQGDTFIWPTYGVTLRLLYLRRRDACWSRRHSHQCVLYFAFVLLCSLDTLHHFILPKTLCSLIIVCRQKPMILNNDVKSYSFTSRRLIIFYVSSCRSFQFGIVGNVYRYCLFWRTRSIISILWNTSLKVIG